MSRLSHRFFALVLCVLVGSPLLSGCADALVSDGSDSPAIEVQRAQEAPPAAPLPAHAPAPLDDAAPAATLDKDDLAPEDRPGELHPDAPQPGTETRPETTQQDASFKMLRRF